MHANYLGIPFNPKALRASIKMATNALKVNTVRFDAIAMRGVSGLTFGSTLAYRLRKNIIVIRKPADGTHSKQAVEYRPDTLSCIIVDDLISSGDTIRAMLKALREHGIACRGVYLYGTPDGSDSAEWISEREIGQWG